MKNFCRAKGTINKTKRQLTEWKKIFTKDIYIYIYMVNIQRAHTTQHQKKKCNLLKNWVEDLNRNFSKMTYRWPRDT